MPTTPCSNFRFLTPTPSIQRPYPDLAYLQFCISCLTSKKLSMATHIWSAHLIKCNKTLSVMKVRACVPEVLHGYLACRNSKLLSGHWQDLASHHSQTSGCMRAVAALFFFNTIRMAVQHGSTLLLRMLAWQIPLCCMSPFLLNFSASARLTVLKWKVGVSPCKMMQID